MIDAINRWRHRHGFGVHSPLAFTIVTEALTQPKRYRYYEEEAIEVSSSDTSRTNHLTRQLRIRNLIHHLNTRQADPIIYQYITDPTPEVTDSHISRLQNTGGIIFEAKDYLLIIHRPNLPPYHYLI